MKYELTETRYPLTEEEQSKARFILECVKGNAEAKARGQQGLSALQMQALEGFKDEFYLNAKIQRTLFATGRAFNISPDGTELICVSVEHVEK